jgi:phospholipid/cholesterol/gamma-HCH transport system substrate-binding protein
MTAARGVAFGALVVAVIVVAVILLQGSSSHRYALLFQNAGQLVKDDDVQVGGRRVGSVKEIELTNNNLAKVTIEVENGFAPLHEGTTATIRQASLSGIANRYIVLQLGPNSSPKIPDGGTLQTSQTTSPVDLDQIFNTLDPKTLKGLQQVVQGSATQYKDVAAQANEALKYLNPGLSTTTRLVNEVVRDEAALKAVLSSGAKVTQALAQRGPTITSLVSNANQTAQAIGTENVALSTDLQLLPPTLRRANTTFVNLRATLDDLDKLVAASKPATKNLAPFLADLRPLVHDAIPTIHDLRTLIKTPGAGNDLIDLLNKSPGLEKLAGPTFKHTIASLQQSTPVLSFIRPYTPDLEGWFRDFGQSTANYDANGHYARIQPIFNTFTLADNPAGGVLTPRPAGSNPFDGLSTGNIKRCPGTATQIATDQSNDWRDSDSSLDCDPSLVLPGP